MSMTFVGRLPYRAVLAYERVRDETGREMHKSTGNMIEANEAFDRMGADIVRWLFCAQHPGQNINFGYGPASEVKRRLLTLWNSARFFVDYANVAGFRPVTDAAPSSHPLDRWLLARTRRLVAEATDAYERFWAPAEVAEVRRVVELGRQARGDAGIKLRQPLARMVVFGAPRAAAHRDEVAEELRVKEVEFEAGGATRVRFKPNLRVLGPRLGKRLPEIRRALEEGRYELDGDRIEVDGEVLGPEDVLQEQLAVHEGWVVAADGDVSVELDPTLDSELELEGRVLDLIHALNGMRRDAGLELTDRIRVRLPQSQAELLRHEGWIKDEVLAVEIESDGISEPRIEKV